MTQKFKKGFMRRWRVFNVDLVKSELACENYIIDPAKLNKETMLDIKEKIEAFDKEYEAVINVSGHFYHPNSNRYLLTLKEDKKDEAIPLHPMSISSESIFDEYEAVRQSEIISSMLTINLAS